MTRQQQMKVALLECMEFFKYELVYHTCEMMPAGMGERLEKRFTELRDQCYAALGEPTMADADTIRSFAEKANADPV